MKIAGKHVLITGGSRGVGRGIAEVMSARGARLSLVARNPATLQQAAEEIGGDTTAVPTDLGDMTEVARVLPAALADHGPVDILINNAATGMSGPLVERSAAELQSVLTSNLLAPLELVRAALPSMVRRDEGAIVNVSSFSAEIALRNFIPYGASKAGLTLATRAIQRELAGTGVLVQLVVLGVVDTDMIHETDDDPVASGVVQRFSMMPALSTREVAEKIVDGIESGRRSVILPPVGAPMHYLRMLPTLAMDRLLTKLPSSAATVRTAVARLNTVSPS